MPLAHQVPGQPDAAEKSPSLGPHAAVDCSELFRAFKTETKMFCLGKFPLKQRRHPPHPLRLVLSWAAGLCLGLQPARWPPQVCAVCGREAVRVLEVAPRSSPVGLRPRPTTAIEPLPETACPADLSPPHHAAAMRCRSLLGSQVHVPFLVSARFSSLTSGVTFRGEPPALPGLHLCPPRPGATSTHRSAVVFTGVDTESAAGPQGGADLGADSGFYCY